MQTKKQKILRINQHKTIFRCVKAIKNIGGIHQSKLKKVQEYKNDKTKSIYRF